LARKGTFVEKTNTTKLSEYIENKNLLEDIGSPNLKNWKGIGPMRKKSIAPNARSNYLKK